MATAKDRLVEWLRDAHAAEEQAHSMLSRTASHISDDPQFRAGLEQHAKQSEEQAARLKECLDQLGEGTSLLKTVTGQITAFGQTMSGYIVSDEPVKAVLAVSSFAHMEVSSYRILVEAANAAGQSPIAAQCETLLAQERAFADWVDEQVPQVTRNYLARSAR